MNIDIKSQITPVEYEKIKKTLDEHFKSKGFDEKFLHEFKKTTNQIKKDVKLNLVIK